MAKTLHYGSHNGTTITASSFWAAVMSYKAGTALRFSVDEYVPTKTQAQCAYLHVLFDIAAKEMNKDAIGDGSQWTAETVKQHCKDEKLYPVVDRMMPGGVVVQVTLDTRHLNMKQASETIDRVITYFAEWHIRLPHPREQQSLKFGK
jgi:hypothetical protein